MKDRLVLSLFILTFVPISPAVDNAEIAIDEGKLHTINTVSSKKGVEINRRQTIPNESSNRRHTIPHESSDRRHTIPHESSDRRRGKEDTQSSIVTVNFNKKKNIPFSPEDNAQGDGHKTMTEVHEHPIIRAYVTDRPGKKQRKTIIPAGSNVLYDIHDSPSDSYDEVDHDVSRRFDLYPKWFSHRIPPLFGKRFAKRYFHPFGTVSNRAHIAHKHKAVSGSRRSFSHDLPESWMHAPMHEMPYPPKRITINELPKEFVEMTPGKISPIGPRGPALNLANAVGEIVDIPDNQEDNPDGPPDYNMNEVPHEMMHHLNSMEYAPYPGHPDDHWMDYESLPHGHHHVHDHNPCHHSPCLNAGSCHFSFHTKVYNFRCGCRKGFSGHFCEHTQFSCHPNPCQHDGTCTKTSNGFFCTCPQDYKGHHCEIESACLRDPCLNNGICTETADGFYCQCEKGYIGKSCEEKESMCSTSPCHNGGTCRELEEEGRFECTCSKGFGCIDCSCPIADTTGITEAAVSSVTTVTSSICPSNACKNGGTCVKSTAGFSCNCPNGFHGMDCGTPDLCNPNPCENAGVCVQDADENYKCVCPYGFKGADCQTPLACSSHPCINGATCLETPEGFHCKCSPGYKGKKCTDLSPCSRNPCTHKSTCLEKGTMYTCSCKSGYRGKNCREKDPCFPNPCLNGVCGEINGLTTCNCTRGWMGETCDIENLCQENRCLNGATCAHTLEEFKCVCPEGFHGTSCEYRSPCHWNPCEHGGICEGAGSTYVCRCGAGFHGERCHLSSQCHPAPCQNGGRCFEGDEGFICECPHGFSGKYCEERHFCISDPCMNGGHCSESGESFHCSCLFGYLGRICDLNVCDHNPCLNGGTCMPANTEIGYSCECAFPYHGHNCDDVDPCVPNPCKNAGTCHSHLQRIHDMNFHIGPQFHGTDENVVSVVGPMYNETVHHTPYYDDATHEISYLPDAHLQSHEVNHFHLTSDGPNKVYQGQLYHAQAIDSDDDEHLAHHGHVLDPHNHYHIEEYPTESHSIRKSYYPEGIQNADADKRSLKISQFAAHEEWTPLIETSETDVLTKRNSRVDKRKRDKIMELTKRNQIVKKTRVQKKNKILQRIDKIPKVLINIRSATNSALLKRTIHDLYVCQCIDGYLGAHCQHMNPCQLAPCNNGGTCIPRGNRYQCHCINGYGGLNCDDPHPCTPNPCNHNGKCVLTKSVHGYHCDCQPGWRNYNCESRDHCALNNPCQHGGKCISLDEGVECRCRARFSGDLCETDKCSDCDPNAFCRHGHCVCRPSFVGNGFKCKALGDVCQPNPCDNKGICHPGQDGRIFSCDCPLGYVGARCEFPHPCISMPCMHNGACIDESNSKEKGILMLDRHDYKCFCTQGYRGKNCEETSLAACSSGPCENNGTCFDSSSETHRKHLSHVDDYECFCERGHTGKNCELNHFSCYSEPCMNGGSCLDTDKLPDVSFDAHGYKCNCRQGFTGRNCEVTLSGPGPCHFGPCLHDGRCVDITNNNDPDLHFDYDHEFKCFCSPQFSGRVCEVPYPACYSMPCLHNGTCIDRVHEPLSVFDETGYHCQCMAGYEGKNCERQYAFASPDEEDSILHPTELPESEAMTPTPLVVYMKASRTPTKPEKVSKPNVVIVRQTTLMPVEKTHQPKVMELVGTEKPSHLVSTMLETTRQPNVLERVSSNEPYNIGLAHVVGDGGVLLAEPVNHQIPVMHVSKGRTGTLVEVRNGPKLPIKLLNPSPTKPIILKEWSGTINNLQNSQEVANYEAAPYKVEQYKYEPAYVRTIETPATPYDDTRKQLLSSTPASMWRHFYHRVGKWFGKQG